MTIRISRRRLLTTAAATGIGALAMPYLSRAADRPQITHGVQSGDVGADGGVVWARADRPSQMMVEVATTESFSQCAGLAADRGAARKRLHRENAAGKSARRAGDFLSRPVPGPCASRHLKRAGDRPLPHRAGRPPRRQFRVGRRRRRTRLGHQSRRRRHGHLRHHAQAPAGFPAAFRRHHLCRRRHCRRSEARRRQGLEERHHPGEGKSRRDARRVSRGA